MSNLELIPAIIQDQASGKVLMLGYMNQEALAKTEALQVNTVELKKITT